MPQFSFSRVLKGTTYYGLSEIAAKSSNFLLIPLFTRLLTPAEYGIVGYFQVILVLTASGLGFGTSGAQVRAYYEVKPLWPSFGSFTFTVNLAIVVIGSFIVTTIIVWGGVSGWVLGREGVPFWPMVPIILVAGLFQAIGNNAISLFKALQKHAIAASLQFIRFGGMAAISVLLMLTVLPKVEGRILGIAIGTVSFAVLSFFWYWKYFEFRLSKKALLYAVSFGFPVVLHQIANVLHNLIDRVILANLLPMEAVGHYTVAYSLATPLTLLVISFGQAFQPSFYQSMNQSKTATANTIRQISHYWVLVVFLTTLAGVYIGPPILALLVPSAYNEALSLLPLMFGSVFFGSFYYLFSPPIFYLKKTWALPLMTSVSVVLNVTLNYLLIPIWGTVGAAWSTIVSHAVFSLLAFVITRKFFPVKWPIWIMLLSASVVTISIITI
jgi:O-antigen/teichoic acid export membrane protein